MFNYLKFICEHCEDFLATWTTSVGRENGRCTPVGSTIILEICSLLFYLLQWDRC